MTGVVRNRVKVSPNLTAYTWFRFARHLDMHTRMVVQLASDPWPFPSPNKCAHRCGSPHTTLNQVIICWESLTPSDPTPAITFHTGQGDVEPAACFCNKVLLAQGPLSSFMPGPWLLWCFSNHAEWLYQRSLGLQSINYSLALWRKRFPVHDLWQCFSYLSSKALRKEKGIRGLLTSAKRL